MMKFNWRSAFVGMASVACIAAAIYSTTAALWGDYGVCAWSAAFLVVCAGVLRGVYDE